MDKYARLADLLRGSVGFEKATASALITAQVVSIEDESCTVLIGDMEVTEVRLKATINEADDFLLVIPKIGTYVLIGSLTGDLKDLAVMKIDQVDKLLYKQNGLELLVDSSDQKVSIKNGTVSMVNLLQALTDLLRTFKVYTSTGPSGTPLPNTMQALAQFETMFKALLK